MVTLVGLTRSYSQHSFAAGAWSETVTVSPQSCVEVLSLAASDGDGLTVRSYRSFV